jgi:hypothetical protein
MERNKNLSRAAQLAIAALVVLGLVGGSLIIARSGFATLPKSRGVHSVFVPVPQAYLMAAALYGQSVIGAAVLLRARSASATGMLVAGLAYLGAAFLLVSFWR